MNYVRTIVGFGVGMAIVGATLVSNTGVGASAVAAGDAKKGEKVYATLKCSMCHKIGAAGGKMGPDLSVVGAKRDAAWLKKYLPDPKAQDPKNKMPVAKAAGQDLEDLVAYLGTLKSK